MGMAPAGVDLYRVIEREIVTFNDGHRAFAPIIASFDGFADPCPFRDYCRWLIASLRVTTTVSVVAWPDEVACEDFIDIDLTVQGVPLSISLDWGIGIANAEVPPTTAGDSVLSLIERTHAAGG
jgi:hypothetical protein